MVPPPGHVIPKKDAYDVLMYSPLRDSSFFCFELYYIWEIAFSPTKDEYNEYNCISANIVHEVLKHVSDISWGYVTPGGGGTPIHYLYGYVPPNGAAILKLLV